MLAIIDAYHAGLLKVKNWYPNILSGIIVAVVALPLAMAFAIASGATPEQGLYTAIVSAFVVGVVGGSRVQIAGPTGAFVVILASITAHYGIAGLQIASFLAGFILLIMGCLRLGSVIKFIPDPVISGFTSGIGVIIFVGEWKDFFGLKVTMPLDASFYHKIIELTKALPQADITTTILASVSVLLMLVTPKLLKRVPGPLVAMVMVTALQLFFHFKHVATIGSVFGAISQHLPTFHWPKITWDKLIELSGPAFTIALLGAIESLLSATAADALAQTRHHSNQELIGQGCANILSPLFGGFAATGAIARTATNIRNGGNSPIAAITHSVVLILVLVLLAPLASQIPLCTLAAILFVVAYNMSDVPHFVYIMKHAPSYDRWVLLVTFLLTVFTNLVLAVSVGIILAMIFFIKRMHQTVSVEQLPVTSHPELAAASIAAFPKEVMVYSIRGPLFFGAVEKIEHALAITHTDPKAIIFCLQEVPFMDLTGLGVFREVIERYSHRGVKVYLCGANSHLSQKLARLGILKFVVANKIFPNLAEVSLS